MSDASTSDDRGMGTQGMRVDMYWYGTERGRGPIIKLNDIYLLVPGLGRAQRYVHHGTRLHCVRCWIQLLNASSGRERFLHGWVGVPVQRTGEPHIIGNGGIDGEEEG